MPHAKMIPQAMGPARPKRGIRKYAPRYRKGGCSLGEWLKSLMDDSGISLSLRTRSAVGESALIVARQSIHFDLFAALLNFWNNTTPKWHRPYVNAHETPTRFLYPGDKKEP